MAEYIEREAALEAAKKSHLYFDIKPIINSISAAEVRPVVRGKWKKKNDDVCYWFECSVCGQRPPWNEWGTEWQSPFCPNCGAMMEES